jgi:adenylate kinase
MLEVLCVLRVLEDVVLGFTKAEQAKAVQRQLRRKLRKGEEVQLVDLHFLSKRPAFYTPSEMEKLSNPKTRPRVLEKLKALGLERAQRLGMG